MMLTFARVSKEVSKEDGEWTEAKNVKEKGNMHRDILMIGKFVARRLQPCYISHFFICFMLSLCYMIGAIMFFAIKMETIMHFSG